MSPRNLLALILAVMLSTAGVARAAEAGDSAAKPESAPGAVTIQVGGGEVTLYGHADLSFDYVDNGLSDKAGAIGNNGWLPQVSSNLSYFGLRGSRALTGWQNLKGVFQFETEVQFTATPGDNAIQNGGQSTDTTIKAGIASRNSFAGLQGDFGALKIGKTDAPYKTSTARMDPFASTLGDYNSIVGNTGGDNRAEFDTRLSHAIWYESPAHRGLSLGVLVAPGQNRSNDNSITARGEPDCTGGNSPDPTVGGCTDGSFGTAWSAALTYSQGPLYAIGAYEHHAKVNRSGDDASNGGPAPAGAVGIGAEYAWKVGVQYTVMATGTTVNVLYERMKRDGSVDAFNERTRNLTTWVALTQKVSGAEINLGWAHAGKTPGDPGAGPIDNQANMFAIGVKHRFDAKASVYLAAAEQLNHKGAHFDLGASGHGVVVDCKDAANSCFTGTTIKAASAGLTYDF
jgi:Gram-negative porin